MKFHEFRPPSFLPNNGPGFQFLADKEIEGAVELFSGCTYFRHCMYESIADWFSQKRPFYNVYPNAIRCLRNTSLEFPLSNIAGGERTLVAVCTPVGSEIESKWAGHPEVQVESLTSTEVSDCHYIGRIQSFIIDTEIEDHSNLGEECDLAWLVRLTLISDSHSGSGIFYREFVGDADGLLSDFFDGMSEGCSPEECDLLRVIFSLTAGILLLAKDERFAEPILLNRDAKRKFKSKEDYDRAVARAKRNGRNGMAIGKDIEISPHFRRPHMAIRWTGEGRRIPRLVPVTGCVVSRKHLYPVPTGYMDKERKEAEIG